MNNNNKDKDMLVTDIYSRAIRAPADKTKVPLVASRDLGSYIQRLGPKGMLATERHADATQLFQILQGYGEARVGKDKHSLHVGSILMVPRGEWHSIMAGPDGLTLLTTYGPNKHSVELRGSSSDE